MENEILFGKNVMEKLWTYARLVGKSECYGFLICPIKSTERIVYDAILAPGQKTSREHVSVEPNDVASGKAELENMGCKAIGFWHSHGGFGLFHSGTDDKNLEELVDDLAGNSVIVENDITPEGIYVPHKENTVVATMNGSSVEINFNTRKFGLSRDYDSSWKDGSITYLIGKKQLVVCGGGEVMAIENVDMPLKMSEKTAEPKKGTGYAYSVVVNNEGGAYYAEMAKVDWCYCCGEPKITRMKKVPVKIVEHIQAVYDEKKIIEEIREKVSRHGSRTLLSQFIG